MGQTLTTPEKILKLAKQGDYATLKDFLAGIQRHELEYQRNRARYLEVQKEDGSTPLIVASERGHIQIVELLLQHGANLHHQNRKGDGGSALHEAVAHKHEAVADLLLRWGANPLVENVKGFTAMDIACADKNVTLLRRTEHAAVFRGWLMMKVPRFGGLGSEWQRRWCVVCHRYPHPATPPPRQVTHLVFLAYKSTNVTVPACRLWLDGARSAEVFNPKAVARIQGRGPAQLGVTLHRKHDAPVGAFYGGNKALDGYVIYLRPDDGSPQSVGALADMNEVVNTKGQRRPSAVAAAPQQPGTAHPALHTPPGTPSHAAADATLYPRPSLAAAATPGEWPQFQPLSAGAALHSSVDEEYARRLQMQYDAELAGQLQNNPSPPAAPGQPPAASGGHQRQPSYPAVYPHSVYAGSGEQSIASYPGGQAQQAPPAYPPLIDGRLSSGSVTPAPSQAHTHPQAAAPAAPTQPPSGTAPTLDLSPSSVPSAPPLISFDTAPPSTAPRPSATAGAAGAGGEDDSNVCVICMDEEATAGFLHGDSVHRCVCKECAAYLRENNTTTCPMCRQAATAIINVY